MKFPLLCAAFAVSALAAPAFPQAGPGVEPPLLLAGKPFPDVAKYAPAAPKPLRTLFVKAGKENGDGSEQHPWNDLQAALCALIPGDRLRVAAGTYAGPIRVEPPCREGKRGSPIQVAFEKKAMIVPGKTGPALALRRSEWLVIAPYLELSESAEPGILVDGERTHSVDVDRARVSGGRGPGIRIGGGAEGVTVSNSRVGKAKISNPGPDSVGIEIRDGAARIRLVNNHLSGNSAGSIRVSAPGPDVRDLDIVGNSTRGGGGAAIDVEGATRLKIVNNTLIAAENAGETPGIVLERANRAVVRSNHLVRHSPGIVVGRGSSKESSTRSCRDVLIERNDLQGSPALGVAIDIEAGQDIRFANNVVEEFANGILLLGTSPGLTKVVVANNIVLGISGTAFALADARAASLFDYNAFSLAGKDVMAESGGRAYSLVRILKGGTMPNSRLIAALAILNRDLARISGVETVDRGTRVPGVQFSGHAPDLGVAEK